MSDLTAAGVEAKNTLSILYDPQQDVVTIEGMRYAGDFFRHFAGAPVGILFKIIERHDGSITISKILEETA